MNLHKKIPDKGDPSDVLQLFPNYNLQLHCCRYWWLQNWEFKELNFPYWRIYHNTNEGAYIYYQNKEYALTPDKVIMIAPNTSYATHLLDYAIPEREYCINGGRVSSEFSEKTAIESNYILHLFIHFNIGLPYDNVAPGIYIYNITDHLQDKINIIKNHLNNDHSKFSFYTRLAIQSLIDDLLMSLPQKSWELITHDFRILKVLGHIEDNLNCNLDNTSLSAVSGMATNAFNRLFKDEIGLSPQRYVKKKRIDKACVLLHHSSLSINDIATQTGFSDRYHFSRIFKEVTDFSPAKYKRRFNV